MSKRLQVIFNDDEFAEVQRAAKDEGLSVSAWVRQALLQARRRRSTGDVENRLAAVRAASAHAFPTSDVDQMLGEIEKGYLSS